MGYSPWGLKEADMTEWTNTLGAAQVTLTVKNLPSSARNVRDTVLIPGLGRSPGEGNGNPLQYSCLENPMDRGAWCLSLQTVPCSHRPTGWTFGGGEGPSTDTIVNHDNCSSIL